MGSASGGLAGLSGSGRVWTALHERCFLVCQMPHLMIMLVKHMKSQGMPIAGSLAWIWSRRWWRIRRFPVTFEGLTDREDWGSGGGCSTTAGCANFLCFTVMAPDNSSPYARVTSPFFHQSVHIYSEKPLKKKKKQLCLKDHNTVYNWKKKWNYTWESSSTILMGSKEAETYRCIVYTLVSEAYKFLVRTQEPIARVRSHPSCLFGS